MLTRELKIRASLFAATLLSMVMGFQVLIFDHAPMVFNDPKEDMDFGWFVPVFSLYVLWRERRKLLASLGEPSVVGLLMSVPFLFIAFLGVRGIQVRFEMLALIGLLITVPWAFFGVKTAKAVAFPALFMLFCIPMATYLDIITVHLRLFATGCASAILTGVGADFVRVGTCIQSTTIPDFAIDVAAPCSGLRSIFALLALTAGYAYFNQPTYLRRAILFAFAIPLAILGNVARILSICLVGSWFSPTFATGAFHDFSGYIVFLVAIALMVAIGDLITKGAKRCAR